MPVLSHPDIVDYIPRELFQEAFLQAAHVIFSISEIRWQIFETVRHQKSGTAFFSCNFQILPCKAETPRKTLPTFLQIAG